MSPMKGSAENSSGSKLQPRTKMPPPDALNGWSSADLRTLKFVLSEPISCIFDRCFQQADAESTIMGPLPDAPGDSAKSRVANDDSGVDMLAGLTGRTLTTDQEKHMFLRLNYCRHRMMQIFRQFAGTTLTAQAARELVHWAHCVRNTRSDIVRINIALVLAMAKRTRLTGVDYADLVSEGNLALLRSVDKFDCSRGFKFSTYACRAILKSFSRVATRTARYRGHFPTEFDPSLEKSRHAEKKHENTETDCVEELKSILGRNLAKLNDVEEQVIRARFAIDDEIDSDDLAKAKTLEQVGEMIGVTKERVRQIQNKALVKLRTALEQGILAV